MKNLKYSEDFSIAQPASGLYNLGMLERSVNVGGRPELPPEQRRSTVIYVTRATRDRVKRLAEARNVTPEAVLADLLTAAERRLRRKR